MIKMGLWYCEKHRHLDGNPNRITTLFEGKQCMVKDCENTLTLKNQK